MTQLNFNFLDAKPKAGSKIRLKGSVGVMGVLMRENDFRRGDCIGEAGLLGIILGQSDWQDLWRVRLNKYDKKMHNCDGKCEEGHGWEISESAFEVIE